MTRAQRTALLASAALACALAYAAQPDRFKDVVVSGAQSIGTTSAADSKAALDVVSTTKSVLFPRMTSTQRDAISSPPESSWIYNTTSDLFNYYTSGGVWASLSPNGLADKTTTYSITAADKAVTGATAGAAFTITLPAASATAGQEFQIIKKDTSANLLTVSRAGSDTIGDTSRTSFVLHRLGESVKLRSDGSSRFYWATGEDRTERARVTSSCGSTPCTIADQSGSWLTSISRSATGSYQLNIAAGIFSAAPTCTCNVLTTNGGICRFGGTQSSTAIGFVTQVSTTDTDVTGFFVTCTGPR